MSRSCDEPLPGRAKIVLDEVALAEYLQLPEGVLIRHFHVSDDPVAVFVLVESSDLPAVPIDAEFPIVHVRWTETVNEHDAPVRKFEYLWPKGSAGRLERSED